MTDNIFTHPARLCVSVRLNEAETVLIEHAASAAGLNPAQWAQRHLRAALGCLQADSIADVLEDISARAVYLDSLLAAKQ